MNADVYESIFYFQKVNLKEPTTKKKKNEEEETKKIEQNDEVNKEVEKINR